MLVHDVHPTLAVVVPLVDGWLPLAVILGPAQDRNRGGQEHDVLVLLPCMKKSIKCTLLLLYCV